MNKEYRTVRINMLTATEAQLNQAEDAKHSLEREGWTLTSTDHVGLHYEREIPNKVVSESEFQRICDAYVQHNVLTCASELISHLAKDEESEYYDEIQHVLYTYDSEERLDGTQYRYIIDLDERGEFRSSLYMIDENLEDQYVFGINSMSHANQLVEDGFVDDIRDCEQVADYFKREIDTDLPYGDYYLDANDDPVTESSDDIVEAYEHWVISDNLAYWLKQQSGEMVQNDIFGLTIWGRTCTGQSVAMDGVIRSIVSHIENVESNGEY